MVHFLVDRYADGPRARCAARQDAPVEYPEVGVYHPRMPPRRGRCAASTAPSVATSGARGTVGLLLLRSYLLAGNAGHYDGVITALEARGLRVMPAFATGLDARPAIESFFMPGRPPPSTRWCR
jgi:magnesium chelatase subunit H